MDEGLVETNADADAMQSLGVEITFADEWSVDAYPDTGYFITAQSEGVVDSSEKTVLKQAEYLEVIALFFNREHEAAELMKDIVARYACTTGVVAAIAAAAPSKPKVLWAAYNHDGSAGGWTVSDSCPSYHCEFVAAAGGELITSYAETVGETILYGSYPYLSDEQFLAGDASKADVIIFADDIEKYDGLLESLATLKAVANGRMFDLAARRGPGGGFDWFESRIAHPDVVLADIAAVLHPETELAEEHAMQYLHKCGTPIESLSESCDDLSAPTELFAELLPQCSHLADEDEDTLEPVIEVEDEDAAGERGSVARVVGTFVVVSSLTAALL
jgi:ABC-type Fe3+-hydroxamate transport system substrate-binding protein